tara:strand:+ start:685 stop:1146 length:462 start_codon:yes stop_codon:yes gene_type:complete
MRSLGAIANEDAASIAASSTICSAQNASNFAFDSDVDASADVSVSVSVVVAESPTPRFGLRAEDLDGEEGERRTDAGFLARAATASSYRRDDAVCARDAGAAAAAETENAMDIVRVGRASREAFYDSSVALPGKASVDVTSDAPEPPVSVLQF